MDTTVAWPGNTFSVSTPSLARFVLLVSAGKTKEKTMNLVILIVVLLVLFGGGGYYWNGRRG